MGHAVDEHSLRSERSVRRRAVAVRCRWRRTHTPGTPAPNERLSPEPCARGTLVEVWRADPGGRCHDGMRDLMSAHRALAKNVRQGRHGSSWVARLCLHICLERAAATQRPAGAASGTIHDRVCCSRDRAVDLQHRGSRTAVHTWSFETNLSPMSGAVSGPGMSSIARGGEMPPISHALKLSP